MSENYLWRFYRNYYRQGSVEGLFVATEEEIRNIVGKEIYFGEIFGKHSEVYFEIKEDDIEKINAEANTIEQLIPHLGHSWSGYNPLDYIKCEECDETAEWCSCDKNSGESIY